VKRRPRIAALDDLERHVGGDDGAAIPL